MKFFKLLGEHMMASPEISGSRLPTFYPSAASCRDYNDPSKVYGACLRSQWYRCTGAPQSNPPGLYSQYIFSAGNLWEDWLIEQTKLMGIYVANSLKFALPEYYISGEIDIVIKDPETGELIILESKTYSSANYQKFKAITGGRRYKPVPQVQNVLQSAIYLHYFQTEGDSSRPINRTILTYYDRACGGPDKLNEFNVTLRPLRISRDKTVTSVHIDTQNQSGEGFSYPMPGVSMEGILNRYTELMDTLQESTETPPDGDYKHKYSDEEVEEKYEEEEISKTAYEKWKKNPKDNPIGDWQCAWCSYRDTCKADQGLI